MKKLVSLLLVIALVLALAVGTFAADVRRSNQTLEIDGKKVECPAYNIDGYNYFRLRDLAVLFTGTDSRFDVRYDASANAMLVTTGADYAEAEPESWNSPFLPFSPTPAANPVQSAQTLKIDGKSVTGLSVWNIDGYNYFKLAELKNHLGFALTYDEATRTVEITTGAASAGAGDYAAVYAALTAAGVSKSGTRIGIAVDEEAAVTEAAAAEAPAPAPAAPVGGKGAAAENDSADHSGTNVQVDGIDEGDIVKTDGKYIYVLRDGKELTILKADGKNTSVVSRTDIGWSKYDESGSKENYSYSGESKYPSEMFVSDGRLAVISDYYSYAEYQDAAGWHYDSDEYSCVDIYDVSDPTAPKLLDSFGQDGYIRDTRMLNGKVYAVSTYWVWNCEEDNPATYVPAVFKNGSAEVLPAGDIYINPVCESSEYVVLCSYDLGAAELTDSAALLGGGDQIYMNDSNIYVFGSRWTEKETAQYTESVYTVTEFCNTAETDVSRFAVDNGKLRFAAAGTVPGYIDSQFSADEYNGNLRIVTTRDESNYRIYEDEKYGFTNYQWNEDSMSSGLYVLDSALNIIGSVVDLAPGERVYSARFDGEIAYFCTYRNVDPLFAVDVSNPAAPQVLSALKISGFSEYLHSWGSDRLFGFGRETNEETGWTEGLKLVMFNTADKTNVTVENYLVLDASYSEALYNHKAFFIDGNKNIIGFLGEDDYYIFSYTPEDGFKELSHFWFDTYEWNVRGLWIADWAYIIGMEEAMLIDMTTWAEPIPLKIS